MARKIFIKKEGGIELTPQSKKSQICSLFKYKTTEIKNYRKKFPNKIVKYFGIY
jgi:hypothetical protein